MKPDSVRLILIRHGEVDANRSFQYLGHRNDPLNNTGLRQAAAVAGAARELPLDLVISSPLDRARTTAAGLIQPGMPQLEIDSRLIELDFGEWEGRSRAGIVGLSPDDRYRVERWEDDPSLPTPGGESLQELSERVLDWANQTAQDNAGATVAVVSHMGPIKVLLCAALDLPLGNAGRIFLDPATVSVVDWGPEPVVRLVNSHAHMGFANARWLDRR